MRFLLRPGWIALTVGVAAFAFVCAYLLAPWQFSRSDERDGANLALERALSTAPVPRGQLVAPGAAPGEEASYRRVTVTGTYEPVGEVLVRLRSIEGGAASEVLTPLRTVTGETVLVDRGYLRPVSGPAPPPIAPPPSGVVTVTGYQRLEEPASDRAPIVAGGVRQVYSADAAAIGALTGVTASPGYVQLLAGQPGALTATPLPPLDVNSSYSYAWQWLIFGLMAIGAWVHLVRVELRTARREAGDPREDDPRDGRSRDDDPHDRHEDPRDPAPRATGAHTTGTHTTGPGTAGPRTTDEVLADRYGRR